MIWIVLILFPHTRILLHKEAMLYIFEDNEAVIKMIIKGRNPTMRLVSRTHRVALDWLTELIWIQTFKSGTSTPNINSQTCWPEVISQPFQMSFLRSEFQLDYLPQNDGEEYARTKRRRQDCDKIKAYGDELDFPCLDKFLIREPSDCVEKAGGYSKHLQWNLTRGQQEGLKDAYVGGWWLKLRRNLPREIKVRNRGNFPILNPGAVSRKKWRGNLLRPARKIYGRSPTDDLNDLDVNTAVWGTFMNVTLQAAATDGPQRQRPLRHSSQQNTLL